MFDLKPAADRLNAVLKAITDDQLDGSTPCENYQVSGLVQHVIGLTQAFTDAAGKTAAGSRPPEPTAKADLPDGWRDKITSQLEGLVDAWRDPAAWEGMTEAGGVQLPGDAAAGVALQEIVVHGWDLARATGQEFDVDAGLLEELQGITAGFSSDEGVPGLFGPRVPVADDAPPLDRIIGMTGRDPSWAS